MRIIPHLSFNGQCEEAFRLYEECLGGQITLMLTYGGSPMADANPELAEKIVHATLKVGDQVITGADVPPNRYERPQGFAVQLNIDNADEAERVFNAFAEGGTVLVAFAEDVLGESLWDGHRPVWDAVGDQLHGSRVISVRIPVVTTGKGVWPS